MKLRPVQRLVRQHLAPQFPEMRLAADVLGRWDGDPILRGFLFERHDEYLRLYVFAQPLFVPREYLVLNIAEDLGDYWFDGEVEETELMTRMLRKAECEGRAFLDRVSDCVSLAGAVRDFPRHQMDESYRRQVRSLCLLWSGPRDEAAAELDELIERLQDFKDEVGLERLTQIKQVREALARSESEARALLEGWASATAKALKLG